MKLSSVNTNSERKTFSGHAAVHARFRPTYPARLFVDLTALCPRREVAYDVGAGNGQVRSWSAFQAAQEELGRDPIPDAVYCELRAAWGAG